MFFFGCNLGFSSTCLPVFCFLIPLQLPIFLLRLSSLYLYILLLSCCSRFLGCLRRSFFLYAHAHGVWGCCPCMRVGASRLCAATSTLIITPPPPHREKLPTTKKLQPCLIEGLLHESLHHPSAVKPLLGAQCVSNVDSGFYSDWIDCDHRRQHGWSRMEQQCEIAFTAQSNARGFGAMVLHVSAR